MMTKLLHGGATIQHGTKMKINEIDDNVIQGPWKKPEKPRQISMMQAFGGREQQALDSIGINFVEKPSEFAGIDNREADGQVVSSRQIKKLGELIGRKIESYDAYHVLAINPSTGMDHPQVDANFNNTQGEETFILWFPPNPKIDKWYTSRNKYPSIMPNSRYLVNRTGASKYIRNWIKITD